MNGHQHAAIPTSRPQHGFVRHDLFITAAIICIALAVVIPQAQKHGWLGALLALFAVVGVLLAVVGVLVAITWLIEQLQEPSTGWWGAAKRWMGHLLRFALFGGIASAIAAGLCLWHGLSPLAENLIALGATILGGVAGAIIHHRLGPGRFWPTFRRFCLALLGSFFGGILGILGPGNWGVDIGILVPLLIFAILAAIGKIIPPLEDASIPPT